MVRIKLTIKVLPQQQLTPATPPSAPDTAGDGAMIRSFLDVIDDPAGTTLAHLADRIRARYSKLYKQ